MPLEQQADVPRPVEASEAQPELPAAQAMAELGEEAELLGGSVPDFPVSG